jgi:hypothetical protein
LFVATLVFFSVVAVLLLVAMLVLVAKNATKKSAPTKSINDFLPVHYQHFVEVDRRLAEYEETLKKVESDRRDFALKYLTYLRTDFEHISRLLNLAAKFVPEITLRGEMERFWIRLKFRLQFRLVQLQVRFGMIPAVRLKGLTASVRLLARSADQFLNDIAREHGLHILKSDLNR